MMRIVLLEQDSVKAVFPHPGFPHEWVSYPVSAPGDVVARLENADVAIVNKLRIDAAALERLPELKMIAVAATGADNIDLAACVERGIIVSNVRGYAADTLPEHVFMLMLALRRNLLNYVADVRAGLWAQAETFCLFNHPVRDLHGATLGIVGGGALGGGVARLAEAFGMRVLLAERKGVAEVRPGRTAFDHVLRESDIVSIHCPLNAETRGLIGAAELAEMPAHAILINTARGGIVDEQALAHALRSGLIAGAATDVLSVEPPREGNPLLAPDLANLIVTPHMAWASAEAMQALADQVVANIEAFVAGEPRHRVA